MKKEIIFPAFKNDNIAIVLQSSDFFAPYCAVTVQSIISNVTDKYNYDIIITTRSMKSDNIEKITYMANDLLNVSIRVVNVEGYFENDFSIIKCENYGGGENLIRLALMDLMPEYEKVLNLDCDMIVLEDIANLYNVNIDGYFAGAVGDIFPYIVHKQKRSGIYFTEDRVFNLLGLDDISQYYNGGVYLHNLSEIKKKYCVKDFVNYIFYNRMRYLEQDAFSHFFRGNVYRLDSKWNYQCNTEYDLLGNLNSIYDKENYRELLIKAENERAIIHYLGTKKPWDAIGSKYASVWWSYLFRTSFYKEILERKNNVEIGDTSKEGNKRVLFVCETVFQLITMFNIKDKYYQDVSVDVIFTSSSDFSMFIDNIRKLNLFENIYLSGYVANVDIEELRMNAPNTEIVLNPENYKYAVRLSNNYTDYYMSVASSPYQKIVYYQLVKRGNIPKVHIYEDGWGTYIESVADSIKNDIIDHEVYEAKRQFVNNISDYVLYRPDLLVENETYAVNFLNPIRENSVILNSLYCVFGKQQLPNEKYIFFDECFSTESRTANDFDILDVIADRVGKENVVVKLHPRSENKRIFYKLRGYKVLEESIVPWEIMAATKDVEKKVLISISSASPTNPTFIFGYNVNVVFLWNVMKFSKRRHMSLKNSGRFLTLLDKVINENEKRLFSPNTMNELTMVIDYLEGVTE